MIESSASPADSRSQRQAPRILKENALSSAYRHTRISASGRRIDVAGGKPQFFSASSLSRFTVRLGGWTGAAA
jgi:hypothetical protein